MAVVDSQRQLGEILVDQGVISPLELDEALQRQRLTGEMLGRVLFSMGLCEEQDVVDALGMQQGMERIDVSKLKVSDEVMALVPAEAAKFYNIAPVRIKDGHLMVAMADPLNLSVLDDVAHIAGMPVKGAISNLAEVSQFLKDNYAFESDSIQSTLNELVAQVGDEELTAEELGTQEVVADADNLAQLAMEPEVIKIVNLVLLDAIQKRASDIHFEVYEEDFRIRLRVDGLLQEVTSPPKSLSIALVSRIKVMCNMDIGERRLPQDARIDLKIGDTEVDIRVSTLPTLFGEGVVMRVQDRSAVRAELEKLGLADDQLATVNKIIEKPNGIFLVTGPTGCGKTTSLYGCVNKLNRPEVKIITVEDPVELQFDRMIQVQVKESVGMTFASALRSILRQDPDIVMIGEIRDLETAQIAVEASLTGHLVLSSLHTNSAPETITRLIDMDLEPFLITSSLEGVLAQRLVRTICRHCREAYRPDEEELEQLGVPDSWRNDPNLRFYKPKGCPGCDYIGYKGRMALFELLVMDDTLREMINASAMAFEIRQYARKTGMRTLREDGLIRAFQGHTSPAEILAHTDKYDD